ncbi:TetR/AcrR family transcriptional regulator [Rhodococcus triatomae]
MSAVRSRRELYSEATRNALIDEATTLFAERGYAGTSLEDIAASALLTRGAVYHHFAGKQALFEAVLDRLGIGAIQRVAEVASKQSSPEDAAIAGFDAFLGESCDPVYGKLVWQEGPLALGWEGWRRCEQDHSYALVEGVVLSLMHSGYLEHTAERTTVRIFHEMLGGAGLALAEASAEDKPQVRRECTDLFRRVLLGLHQQAGAAPADG